MRSEASPAQQNNGSAGASPSLAHELPVRSHPVHGVYRAINRPTIVFLTVCTKDRKPYLATDAEHRLLVEVWRAASAWLVGRYVVMPDHIHLFAAPNGRDVPFDNWVKFWKSQFSRRCGIEGHSWQSNYWDRTLRSGESYEEKWLYVRDNAKRHGLIENSADWPFQGQLNELRW